MDPVPWHYDTGEVLYSSSSIHRFHRSGRNGRLYRHTGTIELYMTRLGTYLPDDPWRSHAYRYRIEVPVGEPAGGAP